MCPPSCGVSPAAGKPFVVRESERPFSNLEYTGIDRERVEEMEARLKQDVLVEVRRRRGHARGRGQRCRHAIPGKRHSRSGMVDGRCQSTA